jgi:hypothetical protein
MDSTQFPIIFLFSLLFGGISAYLFKKRNPWGVFWIFFLVIFFAAWAGSFWIKPIGPMVMGVSWIPSFAISFFIAVLIAAATSETNKKPSIVSDGQASTGITVSAFVWIIMIFLIFSVVGGYMLSG